VKYGATPVPDANKKKAGAKVKVPVVPKPKINEKLIPKEYVL
jgi:hypothetical protein